MDRSQIGKRLKALRGERSMGEVARALGVSRQTVSFYEQGRMTPKDDQKIKIARYYGLTVQDIFFAE
jgi:DNA-binding XRE family transcriptional regulator